MQINKLTYASKGEEMKGLLEQTNIGVGKIELEERLHFVHDVGIGNHPERHKNGAV